MDFPIFNNPGQYLRKRDGRFFFKTWLKRWYEQRALDKCLSKAAEIDSVCDIPCGPGRLFAAWNRKQWRVHGIDLSDEMLSAAKQHHKTLDLDGSVQKGNAFEVHELPRADLVSCVRFAYYFERKNRIKLLKSLSSLAHRYVLVQYKSSETSKGRRNASRTPRNNDAYRKYFATHDEMRNEIFAAGLEFIDLQPIAESSDRVFVLAKV